MMMTTRRVSLLRSAVVLSALLGVSSAAVAMRGATRREHVVAAEVPRLSGITAVFPDVQSVRAVAMRGGQVYLLDALAHKVHVARVVDGRLEYVRSFAREGGGPGELAQPTGIAAWPGDSGVVVADGMRLHVFTGSGRYIETLAPHPPCGMALPQLARGRDGLLLYGDCLRRGPPDTMSAVIAWSRDGRDFSMIASDARFSMDGEYGNIFGTRNPFAGGLTHDLFGAGVGGCLYTVMPTGRGAPPRVTRRCGVSPDPFPLHLREGTRELLGRGGRGMTSKSQRLPRNHPAFTSMLAIGGVDYVLRSYSEDSLVLRSVGGFDDLAVMPMPGLIGCSREGCIRAVAQMTGTQITFYPLDEFAAAARRRL